MKRKLLSRLGGGVVAAALAVTTLSAVGAATPASAAPACTTTTTLRVGSTTVEYGGYNSLNADVDVAGCTGGSDSSVGSGAGTVSIQRSVDGRTWQTLKTGDYSSFVYYYGSGVTNTSGWYRAVYTGGKESYTGGSTFSGSASAAVRVDAIRAVAVRDKSKGGHILGRFKVTPTAGLVGKKLTFQVQKGRKWKRYKRVKLRANGVMKVTFKGSRKGIKYRLLVPAAAGLSAHTYGPYVARRY